MADSPRSTDAKANTDDDTGVVTDPGSKPRIPRWLKVGIIVAILVVLVALLLTGVFGGGHGPGQFGPGQHGS
jgi:t-SNARE complex subunit (syntaxin)